MSTYNHTAIVNGDNNDASTVEGPLAALDAAIGDLSTLATSAQSSTVAAINEIEANTSRQSVASTTTTFSGTVDADALTINGTPVGTSTDTYWNAVTGGIAYGSKIGIGTGAAEPASALELVGGITATNAETLTTGVINKPINIVGVYTTDTTAGSVRAVFCDTTSEGTEDIQTLAGFYAYTTNNNTAGEITHMWGTVGRALNQNTGDVLVMSGIYGNWQSTGAGTVASASSFYGSSNPVSAGTVTASYGMILAQPSVSGTGDVVNNYGIRVQPMTAGSYSNYGIYVENATTYGIYNVSAMYNGGAMTVGGALSVGAVTPGDLTLVGDMTVYNDTSVGSELVTNGGFTSDTTGWSSGGGGILSSDAGGQSGNALTVTNQPAGGSGYAYASISTTAGKLYRLTFYFKTGTASNASYAIGTSAGGSQIAFVSLATAADWTLQTKFFQATTSTTYLRLSNSVSTANLTNLFDTVSVVDVQGGDIRINGLLTHYNGTTGLGVTADGHGFWNGATDNGALNVLVADAEAVPVLSLEQNDVSEEIIQITSAAGTGNAVEAVGAKTLTVTDFIKITLNGATRYIQAGTIA